MISVISLCVVLQDYDASAGLFLIAVCAFFYFLPSIIGAIRKKQNAGAIFALNLFLGWTLIGWVIALVWALAHDAVPTQVIVNQVAPAAILCPSCGKYSAPGSAFCQTCGSSLTARAS